MVIRVLSGITVQNLLNLYFIAVLVRTVPAAT